MITIFVSNNAWKAVSPDNTILVEINDDSGINAKQAAEQLATEFAAHDYTGQEAILAIPSTWCLAGSINTDNLPRKDRHQAMIFRLEEKLPIPAEDIIADFIPNTHEALGCCVQTDSVKPIVDSLEQKDIVVQTIVPASLLALQSYLESTTASLNAVVWQENELLNLFIIDDHRPNAWFLLPANQDALAFHLKSHLLHSNHIAKVACLNLSESNIEAIQDITDVERVDSSTEKIETAAARIAPAILADKPAPWINFRQNKLAATDPLRQIRRPLNYAIITAAAFLIVLSASFFLRAQAYYSLADKYDSQCRQEYRKIFKNKRMPLNIRARLESEATKLAAINGESNIPTQTSALTMLYEVLRRLPNTMRYQILKLHINNDKFLMEGKVRTLADVDRLASSLRTQKGFQVNQPRAQKNRDRGVDFAIRAQLGDDMKSASPKAATKGRQ